MPTGYYSGLGCPVGLQGEEASGDAPPECFFRDTRAFEDNTTVSVTYPVPESPKPAGIAGGISRGGDAEVETGTPGAATFLILASLGLLVVSGRRPWAPHVR